MYLRTLGPIQLIIYQARHIQQKDSIESKGLIIQQRSIRGQRGKYRRGIFYTLLPLTRVRGRAMLIQQRHARGVRTGQQGLSSMLLNLLHRGGNAHEAGIATNNPIQSLLVGISLIRSSASPIYISIDKTLNKLKGDQQVYRKYSRDITNYSSYIY